MKKSSALLLCLLTVVVVHAQTATQPAESPIEYYNKFQNFTNKVPFDTDSAFYFAQKLASNEQFVPLLSNLIHTSFAQAFIPRDMKNETDPERVKGHKLRISMSQELLASMMADPSERLREVVKPVYLWTEAQKHADDDAALTRLTREFLSQKANTPGAYGNKIDRYGLLLYQIVVQKEALKPLSAQLIASIEQNLLQNQIVATDSSSRAELDKRAYYRYLYAYTNYLKAQATSETAQKEVFLKKAFD
ncbi:MAG: hypothetical protein KKG00_02905, partial [Bacteroidetes bacterium]|nr:hypothetical protein [Bacteroidota bacterium]